MDLPNKNMPVRFTIFDDPRTTFVNHHGKQGPFSGRVDRQAVVDGCGQGSINRDGEAG